MNEPKKCRKASEEQIANINCQKRWRKKVLGRNICAHFTKLSTFNSFNADAHRIRSTLCVACSVCTFRICTLWVFISARFHYVRLQHVVYVNVHYNQLKPKAERKWHTLRANRHNTIRFACQHIQKMQAHVPTRRKLSMHNFTEKVFN